MEDRRHLLVFAELAELRVGLEGVRPRQQVGADHDDICGLGGGADAAGPAGQARHRARLSSGGRKQPELTRLLVGVAFGVRTRRDEQHVAARRERRARLAFRGSREPLRGARAVGGHGPQRPFVPRRVLLRTATVRTTRVPSGESASASMRGSAM